MHPQKPVYLTFLKLPNWEVSLASDAPKMHETVVAFRFRSPLAGRLAVSCGVAQLHPPAISEVFLFLFMRKHFLT